MCLQFLTDLDDILVHHQYRSGSGFKIYIRPVWMTSLKGQTKLCDIFRGHKWWRKQKFGAPMTSWKGFNWRHKFNVVNRSLKFNLKPDQRDWHFTSDNKIGDTPFLHIFMRLAWTKLLSTMGHQDYATCRVKTKKTKLMPVTGCVVTGNFFLVTNPRKHHWTRHVQASDTCYLRLGWFAPW